MAFSSMNNLRFATSRLFLISLAVFLTVSLPLLAAKPKRASAGKSPPRAAPPNFTDEEKAKFPEDAFLELIGERPVWVDPRQIASQNLASNPSADASKASNAQWSDWIDEETLESEVKRQAKILADSISSAARFKSGKYRQAKDALGMISVSMAINGEHDGVPRWQNLAVKLREQFATGEESLGDSLKADDVSFETTSSRSEDLAELIRGGRPNIKAEPKETDWSRFASRGTVMRRMEQADEERLALWTIDRRTWRRNAEAGRHEAQVLAALAEAIMQPTAYDGDDEDYQAYARALRDAATAIATAAEEEDQPAAQAAYKKAMQSCMDCHADYRG